MLGVNLEDTKVGREMKAEGRLEVQLKMIPKLVGKGLSIEEIADLLELPMKDVRKALTNQT